MDGEALKKFMPVLCIMVLLIFVQTNSANLDRPCSDHLEDLKFVLSEIANIRKISLDVELQYRSVSSWQLHCTCTCSTYVYDVLFFSTFWIYLPLLCL